MKRLLLLLLGALISSCVNSTQQKCESAIKEYMNLNAKDPFSYEPISFTHLDSVYKDTLFMSIEDLKANNEAIAALSDSLEKSLITHDDFLKSKTRFDTLIYMHKHMPRVFSGYKTIHSYRARNGYGALDLYVDTFYFTSDYKLKGVTNY